MHGEEINVGDLVWLHNPAINKSRGRKLHCPWSGPYRIIKKLSTAVYRIQDTRPNKRKRLVVHFNRLKPCPPGVRVPVTSSSQEVSPPPPPPPQGSAKVTHSTVDQLPAGTNLKFIESEEDMAVDVPQETDIADGGQRADGELQLEDAIEAVHLIVLP